MKISYTKQFVNTLDSILQDEYNDITKREDFLALLTKVELLMNYDEDEIAWFEKHKMRDFFGTVTINGKRIRKLNLLLNILENKNILIATAYDRHNHKTRRYLYNLLFEMECQQSEIEIIKEELPEKYCRLFLKDTKTPKEKHLKVQYDLLKSKRFKIDTESALLWIDDKFYRERNLSSNQKRNYTRMVLALEDKLIFAVEGAKGGRVFTNFNSIKRELRQFCTIDGQKLMSVDLKSSQPYLMAQYMRHNWPAESKSFYDTVTKNDIYLFFLKKWNEANPAGFYREFNITMNKMEDVYLNTRDDIKPEYLKMMFKIKGRKPALEDVFKKEFPFVYERIQEQKEGLAAILQKEESDLFIPVCAEFAEKGCLSVHDSLYFKPELFQIISDKLKISFENKGYKDFRLI